MRHVLLSQGVEQFEAIDLEKASEFYANPFGEENAAKALVLGKEPGGDEGVDDNLDPDLGEDAYTTTGGRPAFARDALGASGSAFRSAR